MKYERSRIEQTQRIDQEKTNKISVVDTLPDRGTEGDFIFLGTPPLPDAYTEGYYVRMEGEWRLIGTSDRVIAEPPPDLTEEDVIEFLSKMENPVT